MLENSHPERFSYRLDERSFVRKFIAFHLHAAKAEYTFKLQFMAGAKGRSRKSEQRRTGAEDGNEVNGGGGGRKPLRMKMT